MYNGIGASSGIGIGRVMIIKEQALSYAPTTDATPEQEIERYKRALNKFVENTMAKAEQMKSSVGEKEAENGEVSVRRQGEGDKGTMKFEEFAKILNEEVQNMINKW